MESNFLTFKNDVFGEIRTMTNEKGETFFVGKDVAKALRYKDTNDAMKKHVDLEDKLTRQIADSGQRRMVIFINESGLYSLILSSKLEQAKAFKRWVTSEVLPQIRRTGGYIPTRDKDGRRLSDDEIVERAYEIVGRTLESINDVNANCLTATQVARLWGMDVLSFNNLLAGMGIQHRQGGRWQLAEKLQGCGLAEERCFFCFSLKGKPRMKRYLVWTPAGIDYLDMAVRKLPREMSANVQLYFNF